MREQQRSPKALAFNRVKIFKRSPTSNRGRLTPGAAPLFLPLPALGLPEYLSDSRLPMTTGACDVDMNGGDGEHRLQRNIEFRPQRLLLYLLFISFSFCPGLPRWHFDIYMILAFNHLPAAPHPAPLENSAVSLVSVSLTGHWLRGPRRLRATQSLAFSPQQPGLGLDP